MSKRDNSGSLSRNKRKEKSTHPDYKGQAVIGGKEYWISGWRKEGNDDPWTSLAFELKKDQAAKPAEPPPSAPAGGGDDWP